MGSSSALYVWSTRDLANSRLLIFMYISIFWTTTAVILQNTGFSCSCQTLLGSIWNVFFNKSIICTQCVKDCDGEAHWNLNTMQACVDVCLILCILYLCFECSCFFELHIGMLVCMHVHGCVCEISRTLKPEGRCHASKTKAIGTELSAVVCPYPQLIFDACSEALAAKTSPWGMHATLRHCNHSKTGSEALRLRFALDRPGTSGSRESTQNRCFGTKEAHCSDEYWPSYDFFRFWACCALISGLWNTKRVHVCTCDPEWAKWGTQGVFQGILFVVCEALTAQKLGLIRNCSWQFVPKKWV